MYSHLAVAAADNNDDDASRRWKNYDHVLRREHIHSDR